VGPTGRHLEVPLAWETSTISRDLDNERVERREATRAASVVECLHEDRDEFGFAIIVQYSRCRESRCVEDLCVVDGLAPILGTVPDHERDRVVDLFVSEVPHGNRVCRLRRAASTGEFRSPCGHMS
jgi:hypothetical protein